MLLKRYLRPLEQVQDRGSLKFRVPIDARTDSRLVLVTQPGPKGATDWDLSVWSSVRFRQSSPDERTPAAGN